MFNIECAFKMFPTVVKVNGLVEDGHHTVGSLVPGYPLIAMLSSMFRNLPSTSNIKNTFYLGEKFLKTYLI